MLTSDGSITSMTIADDSQLFLDVEQAKFLMVVMGNNRESASVVDRLKPHVGVTLFL